METQAAAASSRYKYIILCCREDVKLSNGPQVSSILGVKIISETNFSNTLQVSSAVSERILVEKRVNKIT
jgi:hypothetical protein